MRGGDGGDPCRGSEGGSGRGAGHGRGQREEAVPGDEARDRQGDQPHEDRDGGEGAAAEHRVPGGLHRQSVRPGQSGQQDPGGGHPGVLGED